MRKLLEEIGLEGRRLQMINVSSAMGGPFAWAAAEMTAEIQRMGPNPLRKRAGMEDHPSSRPASLAGESEKE